MSRTRRGQDTMTQQACHVLHHLHPKPRLARSQHYQRAFYHFQTAKMALLKSSHNITMILCKAVTNTNLNLSEAEKPRGPAK
jgi:hypothetical protein